MSSDPEPTRSPAPGPPPLSKPPRSALTMRDMLVALAVLLVVVVVIGGGVRSCSFAPAGPTIDASRLPVVDAPAELRELAPLVPFAVRIPEVPSGWRSNSVDRDIVDGSQVVRTGFVTPEGRYLRLLQSDAAEPALLAVETGAEPVPARGVVEVAGQRWIEYGAASTQDPSERTEEPIWITDTSEPTRLLITGSATNEDFRTLATAVG